VTFNDAPHHETCGASPRFISVRYIEVGPHPETCGASPRSASVRPQLALASAGALWYADIMDILSTIWSVITLPFKPKLKVYRITRIK